MANYRYTANIYDFGRDMYGNPTAHYQLFERGRLIAESGKRREQIGYDGTSGEAALDKLQRITGRLFQTVKTGGDRTGNHVRVAFKAVRPGGSRRGKPAGSKPARV